jgi:hypothetical protein
MLTLSGPDDFFVLLWVTQGNVLLKGAEIEIGLVASINKAFEL